MRVDAGRCGHFRFASDLVPSNHLSGQLTGSSQEQERLQQQEQKQKQEHRRELEQHQEHVTKQHRQQQGMRLKRRRLNHKNIHGTVATRIQTFAVVLDGCPP